MELQSRLETIHLKAKHNKWLQRFTILTRILLALGFTPSGLTKIAGNRFTVLGPDTPVGYFFEALYKSGFYWNFIGIGQLLAAALLLIPRTATLGALIYFSIILNIFVITVSMHFTGTPFITGLMLLGSIYLLCWDYDKLKYILGEKSVMKKTNASTSQTQLAAGQPAPDFTLPNDEGQLVSLADFRGKKVVLYFYPEDDTPGCTKEACSFRDGFSDVHNRRAVVLGVSADSVESHAKFKQKYHLNFPLLSDVDKTVCNAYGVWQEKSMFGRKYWGIVRTTFIIDAEGKIAKIFPKVKVDHHLEEVLATL
jgi:peroxiredoxin Q/BCP